tara:strand:- start:517 stop:687 length:171 start_codon:yes stop_codon:yes gene_type:complete
MKYTVIKPEHQYIAEMTEKVIKALIDGDNMQAIVYTKDIQAYVLKNVVINYIEGDC